jgi:hypothetical protein
MAFLWSSWERVGTAIQISLRSATLWYAQGKAATKDLLRRGEILREGDAM